MKNVLLRELFMTNSLRLKNQILYGLKLPLATITCLNKGLLRK